MKSLRYQQIHMAYYTYYIYILINKYKAYALCVIFLLLGSVKVFSQDQQQIQLANEYLLKGDKDKALELYKDLIKKDANIPVIHNNYLNVLLDLKEYDVAQNYLRHLLKRDPSNIQYELDLSVVYIQSGDLNKADKHLKELINQNKTSIQSIKMISDYLASRSLADYSIIALKESRDYLGNPYLFCLELAMLYRIQGEKDKMVQEYLNYVTQSSANVQYVKNVMQALLTKPDELESLEKILYDKVQQYPNTEVYTDLLIWVTMQQKNFYASFIQARAYDKRYKKEGEKSLEVAQVALDNQDYANAAKIYRYVAKEYPSSPNYITARLGLIRTREAEIKNSYPVKKDSVQTLIEDYREFISQNPQNAYALEASRSQASLYATYLDEQDKAIEILNELIENPKASLHLRSKAKLNLGDIYLLKGEPWESTLLYSQVEKTQRENLLGYEAKLSNAKLSYYKGDFRLAQEHLDILKEATTREIANDAMELSLKIKENLLFDSTGAALQEYASIELLLYQNKTKEALDRLKTFGSESETWMSKTEAFELNKIGIKSQGDSVLVKNNGGFITAAIMDDVYWLEANIRMKLGQFEESIALLQNILNQYPDDVLADDAFFLQADIYDRQLKNKEKAMEVYREFLTKFPGSVYTAEARKRFRTLRGDFNGQEAVPLN